MNIGNILSLFDGISCGQIALNRAGFTYDNYFASEIDKHAIKVTQTNYPNTIQLGDVMKINAKDLPKIDLLIGGSPCQGFSFAGKQLNFEDPRSKLFFEYVRLLKECQPKYFLLENVKMKKEHQDVISNELGVQPIIINSHLFSAQNRTRLYWTNININLNVKPNFYTIRNILENQVDEKYLLKSNYDLTVKSGESRLSILEQNYRKNHKTNLNIPVLVSEVINDTPSGRSRQTDRLYSILSKSPTLLANRSSDLKIDMDSSIKESWRNLTPLECERLQTVPDYYTNAIPEKQRYKCLGNGWTVDVIAHVFSHIK